MEFSSEASARHMDWYLRPQMSYLTAGSKVASVNNLAKVGVEGSNPFARSKFPK